jgi:hypothetical protein
MVKSVEIETRSFPNQKTAKEYFKNILNKYKIKETIPDPDHSDLMALIQRHPSAPEKIGCGIVEFQIMNANQGTRCFRLIREDETTDHFSYDKCITGKAPSQFQNVCKALRVVVAPYIHQERDKRFKDHENAEKKVPCFSSKELISRDEGHMDHLPPMTFQVIVTTFFTANSIDIHALEVKQSDESEFELVIVDEKIAERFKEYHKQIANLDFVKKEINLAQASRNRIKKPRGKPNQMSLF